MVKLLFYTHIKWCRNINIDCGPAESTENKMFHENYVTPRSTVLPDKLNNKYSLMNKHRIKIKITTRILCSLPCTQQPSICLIHKPDEPILCPSILFPLNPI